MARSEFLAVFRMIRAIAVETLFLDRKNSDWSQEILCEQVSAILQDPRREQLAARMVRC